MGTPLGVHRDGVKGTQHLADGVAVHPSGRHSDHRRATRAELAREVRDHGFDRGLGCREQAVTGDPGARVGSRHRDNSTSAGGHELDAAPHTLQ